jgi:hypothetical protein
MLQLDRLHPGAVFVILPIHGFDERNDELEGRLSSWPASRPYGQLKFQGIADAYLYLDPRGSLVWDTLPPEVERDEENKREHDRRKKLQRNQD